MNVNDPNKWVLAPVFVPNKFINSNSNNNNNNEFYEDEESSVVSPPRNHTRYIKSYAEVLNNNNPNASASTQQEAQASDNPTGAVLCPYLMKSGICRHESCPYDHGELCEYCDKYCLDPFNEEQRKQHKTVSFFIMIWLEIRSEKFSVFSRNASQNINVKWI